MSAQQPSSPESTASVVLTDRAMTKALWPLLLAAATGLLPFTLFGTYLVSIAASGGWDVSVVGGMRGLGGVSALVVGLVAAPLLDRISRSHAAAVALVVLAVASALGTAPSLIAIAAFCLLVGAATAVLNPALATMASERWPDDANAGRAATLVSATTSLTAMLAAPLVTVPALLWGWRGTLGLIAVLAGAAAVLVVRRSGDSAAPTAALRPIAALRQVVGRPVPATLLLISLLRTCAFMGWLAYVAALYADRFGLQPAVFAWVWTLSGAGFFLGNLLGGRAIARIDSARRVAALMAVGCAVGCVALVLLVAPTPLGIALLGSVLLSSSHAVIAAGVTTLLVRTSHGVRGAALGLNGVAQSLGVFAGAAIAGIGLATGGWNGVALALGAATGAAGVAALATMRLVATDR